MRSLILPHSSGVEWVPADGWSILRTNAAWAGHLASRSGESQPAIGAGGCQVVEVGVLQQSTWAMPGYTQAWALHRQYSTQRTAMDSFPVGFGGGRGHQSAGQ